MPFPFLVPGRMNRAESIFKFSKLFKIQYEFLHFVAGQPVCMYEFLLFVVNFNLESVLA
ncbi:hypothetical protein LEP1GSC016_2892 [Leptospira borgpetersenii serovar Hardjo-bovis str. Sponselee]|uniref:Uncharacterized protein n=1 Tax=Leptospira borgpetersenii serovar Hardjo-bovis str. Sponselee TaxID=1303729 RepID=M6BIN1_LEPBO|nr:hypothetical protein LEP1GSC016_2892 [Leptospira borgpetersenii serovar Hardjo-bovis str. Sponselee]